MNDWTVEQCIEQIDKCGFTDRLGHPLHLNMGYMRLLEIARRLPKVKEGWYYINHATFIEVLPTKYEREHALGDECWCNPVREELPDGEPNFMLSHKEVTGLVTDNPEATND